MREPEKNRPDEFPRLYSFILNPYPDMRLSRCPLCERKTGQRKLPLFVHVEPNYPIALNYTCRYCRHCDLLIGHKHEIEHLLVTLFDRLEPDAIGNEYSIMGTVDKKAWRASLKQPKTLAEMMTHVRMFKTYYQELRRTRPGWYPDGVEPPEMPPPRSTEWVSRNIG